LAISLAIAFEIGAAASLAAIIFLDKMNVWIVWGLFIVLTGFQMMSNTYYTFVHLKDFKEWIELFGLLDEDPIYQKRILSIISGAILPLIALGFIKSLVDYIRPEEQNTNLVRIQPEQRNEVRLPDLYQTREPKPEKVEEISIPQPETDINKIIPILDDNNPIKSPPKSLNQKPIKKKTKINNKKDSKKTIEAYKNRDLKGVDYVDYVYDGDNAKIIRMKNKK
jgi:hypothetical protein